MNDVLPWYKQFWPWFLIFIPTATVVFCMVLIVIALDTDDSVVVDDYYKKGKAINLELSKFKKAKELNISLIAKTRGDNLAVQFATGKPQQVVALKAEFYHPTLRTKDFTVQFVADANGEYSAELPPEVDGNWRITISPFDNSWKIQKNIALPSTSEILLQP